MDEPYMKSDIRITGQMPRPSIARDHFLHLRVDIASRFPQYNAELRIQVISVAVPRFYLFEGSLAAIRPFSLLNLETIISNCLPWLSTFSAINRVLPSRSQLSSNHDNTSHS